MKGFDRRGIGWTLALALVVQMSLVTVAAAQEVTPTGLEVGGVPALSFDSDEGFGYGALGHFWAGSLSQTFYELGGGGLTEFLDPEG